MVDVMAGVVDTNVTEEFASAVGLNGILCVTVTGAVGVMIAPS